jgi:hypothetical protein
MAQERGPIWVRLAGAVPVRSFRDGETPPSREASMRAVRKPNFPASAATAPHGGRPICGSTARGLAGDMSNVSAIDTDILQFSICIGREFVQNLPVTAALFQVTGNESELHCQFSFSHSSDTPAF